MHQTNNPTGQSGQTYVWFEIWTDEQEPEPYVLILLCRNEQLFDIFDPKLARSAFQAPTLEEAQNWLWEDEFSLADGRKLRTSYNPDLPPKA
jgi:hypothetical protein